MEGKMGRLLVLLLTFYGPSVGYAQQSICDFAEEFVRTRSLNIYKSAPWDFQTWRSSFTLPEFEVCFVVAQAIDEDGVLNIFDTLNCERYVDSNQMASEISTRTILALTQECRIGDVIHVGGELLESAPRMTVFSSGGLAIYTNVESGGPDFTMWRRDLKPNIPSTTVPPVKLRISVWSVEPP